MCKIWGRKEKSKIQNICFNLVTSCAFSFNSISFVWLYLHCIPFFRCWPPAPRSPKTSRSHYCDLDFHFCPRTCSLALPFFLGPALLLQGKWTLLHCFSISFWYFFNLASMNFFPCHCIFSPQKKQPEMQYGFIILQHSPTLWWSRRSKFEAWSTFPRETWV